MSAPPHVCESCGRACGPCSRAASTGAALPHTIREQWCAWCKTIYVDNAPDPDTGRVHCDRCDAPFPGLAALVAAGLDRYPDLCRACRLEAPAPPEPLPSAPDHDAPARDPLPLLVPPDEPIEHEYRCGGFEPRPPRPVPLESEYGSGAVSDPAIAPPRWD